MIILTDADGVLEDLTHVWIELLNETYGRNVKYEDVVECARHTRDLRESRSTAWNFSLRSMTG